MIIAFLVDRHWGFTSSVPASKASLSAVGCLTIAPFSSTAS